MSRLIVPIKNGRHQAAKLSAGHQRWTTLWIVLVIASAQSGCSGIGKGKLVRELQTENSRLLSEYQAEKQRRRESEQRLAIAQQRLAESEKLLARRFQDASGYEQRTARGTNGLSSGGLPSTPIDRIETNQDTIQWQKRPASR